MAITESRKSYLSTHFFSGGSISSNGLINAILADINNTEDVEPADIAWIFGSLGTIYNPPEIALEITAKVVGIIGGSSFKALIDCIAGQVCDLTPKTITMNGVFPQSRENDAMEWLELHLPMGSNITLTPVGSSYIVTKGNEIINNSLNTYLDNLGQETELTGWELMAIVQEIVDGDTIQVVRQCIPGQLCVTTPFNVRLHGVSSSEMNFPAGRTAKTWLADQIPPGTTIKLVVKGEDAYGRTIASIYYPTNSVQSINEKMIEAGKATGYNPTAESLDAKAAVKYVGGNANSYPASCTSTVTKQSGVLQLISPVCNTVKKDGSETWFGYNVKNIGSKDWRGWLGVILTDNDSKKTHQYMGDPAKYSTIAPGETKTLYAKFVVPATMGNKLSWEAVINSN